VSKNTWLINGFFLFAIVISILAIKKFMINSDPMLTKDNPHTPDAYMMNVTYFTTDDQGQQDVSVFSPHVTHYQEGDSATLQHPIIKLHKNSQQWIVTSQEAKSFNGSTRLVLNKNVVVKQLASSQKAGTTLLTESLTAFPKQDLVTTKEKVTIQQPGLNITGVGMKGDLKNGNIQLLSQTKGQYDPAKRS
jgi:lipopolysaccharide export system protein LptC